MSSLNPRHSDVALRLKEKTKKKKEAAEKGISHSTQKDSATSEETTMNLDDSDEYITTLSNTSTTGSGNKPLNSKLRSSSNNSSISGQLADLFDEFCTLKVSQINVIFKSCI